MKLTHDERLRIKQWLEKDPASGDKDSSLTITRADGSEAEFRRTTQYYGENWKVRTAWERKTQFPVCHSSPLPYGSQMKTIDTTNMVPKFEDPPQKEVPAKVKANPGAFAKALDAELKQQKKAMKQFLNAPSVWDSFLWKDPKPDADGKVTFKVGVSDDHKKHLELNKKMQKELNESHGNPR
jgi:hypothetical protein